jgi:hypothetical protein
MQLQQLQLRIEKGDPFQLTSLGLPGETALTPKMNL